MDERRLEIVERENELLRERIAVLEQALYGAGELFFPLEWRLTAHEARLLGVLVRHRLATKSAIMTALYSERADDAPAEKIVDVFICKLRAKIEPLGMKISTAWGQGWALDDASRAMLDREPSARAAA